MGIIDITGVGGVLAKGHFRLLFLCVRVQDSKLTCHNVRGLHCDPINQEDAIEG